LIPAFSLKLCTQEVVGASRPSQPRRRSCTWWASPSSRRQCSQVQQLCLHKVSQACAHCAWVHAAGESKLCRCAAVLLLVQAAASADCHSWLDVHNVQECHSWQCAKKPQL